MNKPRTQRIAGNWGTVVRAASLVTGFMAVWLMAVALLTARPAHAEPACGERAQIMEALAGRYAETPQAMGLSADGAIFEVLVSATGSWTLLITYPNGPTCLVAIGEHWATTTETVFRPA